MNAYFKQMGQEKIHTYTYVHTYIHKYVRTCKVEYIDD